MVAMGSLDDAQGVATGTPGRIALGALIAAGTRWDELPEFVQAHPALGGRRGWDDRVVRWCTQRRLWYRGGPCHRSGVAMGEAEYYEQLVSHLVRVRALFPYHLQSSVTRVGRVTAHGYYVRMLEECLANEVAYDSLPNFTAADCARLTRVGRNEYIRLLERGKGKWGGMLWRVGFGRSVALVSLLPKQPPSDLIFHGWWTVRVVNLTFDEYNALTPDELELCEQAAAWDDEPAGAYALAAGAGTRPADDGEAVAGLASPMQLSGYSTGLGRRASDRARGDRAWGGGAQIEDAGGLRVDHCDEIALKALHCKGLIYLDVPVRSDSVVTVPPLRADGSFVSNRDVGDSRDAWERLLYQVFAVASGAGATVAELAGTLGVEPSLVGAVCGVACRLGFCEISPASTGARLADLFSDRRSLDEVVRYGRGASRSRRAALVVDATLTAFLMMGNFSEGLKRLAVTLLEVGKVEARLLLSELDALCDLAELGEVEVMFDQVWCLRDALKAVLQGAERAAGASARPPEEEETARAGAGAGAGAEAEEEASGASRPGLFEMDGRLDVVRCESLASLGNPVLERMLSRQYAALIGCTPLGEPFPSFRGDDGRAPALDADPPGPPAPFLAEGNALDGSPWAVLLAGLAAGVAPAGLVLPKRASLPEWPPSAAFSAEPAGGTGLIVWAWSAGAASGADGLPAPVAVLPLGDATLSGDAWESINRAALDDALLIQVVVLEGGAPVFRDEPLHAPWRDKASATFDDLGEEDFERDALIIPGLDEVAMTSVARGDDAAAQAAAARVATCMGLGRCLGFVRLVAVPGAGRWAPVGAHLGIPVFDRALASAVGRGAAACLAPQALQEHAAAVAALHARLGRDLLAPHGTLAPPTSPTSSSRAPRAHLRVHGPLLPRHRLLVAPDGNLARQP